MPSEQIRSATIRISYSPQIRLKYNNGGSIVNCQPETIPKNLEVNFVDKLFRSIVQSILNTCDPLFPWRNIKCFFFPFFDRIEVGWQFYPGKVIIERREYLLLMKRKWCLEEFAGTHAQLCLYWSNSEQLNQFTVYFESFSSNRFPRHQASYKCLKLNRCNQLWMIFTEPHPYHFSKLS